jgi:hypothetical protein
MIIHVCMIEESNKCQSFCNLNNSTLWLRVLADKSVERYKATSTEGGRQLLKPIFSSWLPAQVIVVYSCEIGSPFPHCNSASTLNVCFLLCFQMPVTCAQWLKCQCPWITGWWLIVAMRQVLVHDIWDAWHHQDSFEVCCFFYVCCDEYDSVAEGYLVYSQYRAIQHFASAALHVLSTQVPCHLVYVHFCLIL